ncbi:MAG: pyridoxamine 5'-phosphate oxidase [bacterium]|nr:pyridoxamine 5'-phosphate oxidase [Gammaproteobacteria bacterium]HIL94395.1 pyridoxamine 5'-phosphate oxidase [Pseudomonadales bacterium]
MELDSIRREYRSGQLSRADLLDSPFDQFEKWLQFAVDTEIQDPTAMCLATVDEDGRPSQRTVLLKQLDATGLTFFTNLESRKALDIKGNAAVSLHFTWLQLNRQVAVEGLAEKLPLTSVLKYFISRPRESQFAAWASPQSRPVDSRSILDSEFSRMRQKFSQGDVPLPSFWGGYRIIPQQWEFWQGSVNRLHDRFQYRKSAEGQWAIARLAP